MNNIPVFTAAGGTATLILKEIPTRQTAYVLARTWPEGYLLPLLQEAAAFCRAAGAREVLGTADAELPLPHVHDMVTMAVSLADLPAPAAPVELVTVDKTTAMEFRDVYNTCFQAVPNAAFYGIRDTERVVARERCFLAVRDGQTVGMGQLDGHELRAIGVLPPYRGLGTDLALTLLPLLPGPEATVLVSTANPRALALYQKLGFHQTAVVSRWYRL
jgi:ribosomal protein S18 acetylase RimI-like enzyme